MLTDNDRKSIIENYPPLASLDYRPPSSVPTAERLMNKAQRMEDHSLKRLQYLTSAVFRPLDILAHELFSTETDNPNLERYLTMLRDVRKLLLHVCASMTQDRNNIALRAVNPSFSLRSEYTGQYTMPLDEFQQTLAQQTATRKATREATNRFQRKRYNGTSNQSHFPPGTDNSFFRQGPSSQQGGLNSNIFSPPNAHYSNSTSNNNNTNNNNYNRNNSNKKTSNPFRQQQLQ